MRVTSAGSRLAFAQAPAIRSRTISRLSDKADLFATNGSFHSRSPRARCANVNVRGHYRGWERGVIARGGKGWTYEARGTCGPAAKRESGRARARLPSVSNSAIPAVGGGVKDQGPGVVCPKNQ